jgi:uncharacterized GH25 family protein
MENIKRYLCSILLVLLCCILQAHVFWLQPDKFKYNVGETVTVDFKIGDDFRGEPWMQKKQRIESLTLYHNGKAQELKAKVHEGEKDNLKVQLAEEGTHLIVMQSNNAFIKLEADQFAEYLEDDGLDDALYLREKNKTTADSATEFYSRHAKLLVQCGKTTDDTYKKVIGLPIEIIPEQNPYKLKKGDPVKFKILYNGKPFFGAKVKVWNRYNNRTSIQNIFAQQDGMIETHISNPGTWMVSVVKMIPSKNPKAEWQSYWGSLVFGI